jgi:protein TonB
MKLVVILLCFLSFQAFSQDGSNPEEATDSAEQEAFEVFAVAKPAEFPGGQDELRQFIVDNIEYPDSALKYETQGVVVVQFVVDDKGMVGKFKILTPIKGNGLEEEAIRVMALTSGMWSPAMQRDQAVSMVFRMPINFQLY